MKAVSGTWNFSGHQATLAHGRASEVHMNMDVNLHRLPEENKNEIEIYSASCSSYGASGFGE